MRWGGQFSMPSHILFTRNSYNCLIPIFVRLDWLQSQAGQNKVILSLLCVEPRPCFWQTNHWATTASLYCSYAYKVSCPRQLLLNLLLFQTVMMLTSFNISIYFCIRLGMEIHSIWNMYQSKYHANVFFFSYPYTMTIVDWLLCPVE